MTEDLEARSYVPDSGISIDDDESGVGADNPNLWKYKRSLARKTSDCIRELCYQSKKRFANLFQKYNR